MINDATLKAWYMQEILPLEAALTRYLRRKWRNDADITDLRQDIYARILVSAREGLPTQAKPFLFATARNHLINCARRARIVSFEQMADLEDSPLLADDLTPARHMLGREELDRLRAGIAQLPPRCREIVRLRKVEVMSTLEVAAHLSLKRDTVEKQLAFGMRALTDFMQGGNGRIRRATVGKATIEASET